MKILLVFLTILLLGMTCASVVGYSIPVDFSMHVSDMVIISVFISFFAVLTLIIPNKMGIGTFYLFNVYKDFGNYQTWGSYSGSTPATLATLTENELSLFKLSETAKRQEVVFGGDLCRGGSLSYS